MKVKGKWKTSLQLLGKDSLLRLLQAENSQSKEENDDDDDDSDEDNVQVTIGEISAFPVTRYMLLLYQLIDKFSLFSVF